MRNTFVPIVVIGLAWLLDEADLLPEGSWLWVFGLISGAAALLLLEMATRPWRLPARC